MTSGVIGHIGGVERFITIYSRWATNHGDSITAISRSVILPRVTKGVISPVPLMWRARVFTKPVLNLFGLVSFFILGVPVILREYRRGKCQLVFVQDSSFGGLAATVAARLLRAPVAMYSHGLVFEQLGIGGSRAGRLPRFLFKRFQRTLDYSLGKRATVLIAVSEHTHDYFRTLVPEAKVRVLGFGLDPDFIENAEASRRAHSENGSHSDVKIGFLGRLSREKNLATLIAAVDRVIALNWKISLQVVGTGPNEAELRRLARNSSKEVVFTGARFDIERVLSEIDIFAMPSLTEGKPVALMEAMAFAKAIVASDIPSIRSMVDDGKEAILVPPLEVAKWSEALRLLVNDSDLRRKMGEAARRRAESFKAEDQFQALSATLKECLSLESARPRH